MAFLLGLVARLPAGVGYLLSRIASLVLYHVVRYRRDVVRENLAHAFPTRDHNELQQIEKRFYGHFCDLFVEILRSTRMSQAEFAARVRFVNLERLREATDDFASQAIVLLVHQGNWEWMLHGAMAQMPVSVDPVYKPLHSPFWDDYMLRARSRFGATPMAIARVGREVIRGRTRRRLIVMLADQSGPRFGGYWTEFLHRPASFYRGADKLARALKVPVLFAQCQRRERGYYDITFHDISAPPHAPDEEAILERYVRIAEQCIGEQPYTYLWTNRRWKKAPPPEGDARAAAAPTTVREQTGVRP